MDLKILWMKIRGTFPKSKSPLDYGIEAVNNLNAFPQTQITDYLTYVIPGQLDDIIVAKLRLKLPCILIDLNLVDKDIHCKDTNAVIKSAMNTIHSKRGLVHSAILHSIASILSEIAAQGDLNWSEIVAIIEDHYQELKD